MEIEYLIALGHEKSIPELSPFSKDHQASLRNIYQNFNTTAAKKVKDIESTTNHDVKAIEYYLQDCFRELQLEKHISFIHFGLTSQDINTTANMLCLKNGIFDCLEPCLVEICDELFDIFKNKLTQHNQDNLVFAKEGELLLFPSQIAHGYENNKGDGRITLSMNIMPTVVSSGDYGWRCVNLTPQERLDAFIISKEFDA